MYSALQFNFRGIISSCFEVHLTVYVELEEKTLMEHLEKLVQVILHFQNVIKILEYISYNAIYQEETWETEEGSQTNILSSSMQVLFLLFLGNHVKWLIFTFIRLMQDLENRR